MGLPPCGLNGESFASKDFQMVNKPLLDPDETTPEPAAIPGAAPGKELTPAARRALEEAQKRREAASETEKARDINGPSGEEPTRYGDWERKGIAVDF